MNDITYIVIKQSSGKYEFIQFHVRRYVDRKDLKDYIRRFRKYYKKLRRYGFENGVLEPSLSGGSIDRCRENPKYKYLKNDNFRITNIKRLRKALGNLGGAKVRDITINNKDTIIKVDNCETFKNIYLADVNKEMTPSIYDLFYMNYVMTNENEMILIEGKDVYFEMFKDEPNVLVIR
jgi:hypothetical protein